MTSINEFQYNSDYDYYESELEINGISTAIYVTNDKVKEIEILNNRLNQAIDWLEDNYETIKQYCADNLRELKNESWVETEEEKVTEEEFKERLQLESIKIESDGGLELAFQDGDLFWGHWIVVKTDPEYRLNYADIEG